ncbi:sugar transferase [Novosphingobium terrae]|uniref:sugar transferase n=1 Tax=Novosphingobium terrae TaxID=2726189 RepID=UPI001F12EC60|nr:sugar transferase [Novosphingobium terrae]
MLFLNHGSSGAGAFEHQAAWLHHLDAIPASGQDGASSVDMDCDRWIRVADIVLASILLVIIAPVMILIAVAVYIIDPGPVLFFHMRVGRFGKSFPCIKFRSMICNAEQALIAVLAADPVKRLAWEQNQKLEDDPRITKLGKFLRKSSLDELPQLFNVLRGDMSLVGPRPITLAEVPRYGRWIVSYSSVRPGITGLWQVSGRSSVSYRRRVALDVAYVQRRSMRLYGKIVLGTIPAVLKAQDSC